MGRGKGKQKQQQPQAIHIEELEIENKVEIDYDKLALAIVKAKQIEKENEKKEKEEVLSKWQKEIGYNEHAEKRGLVQKLLRLCNGIKVVWNIMFISKKKHIETSPTNAFIQLLTSGFFYLVQFVLTLAAVCFVGAMLYHPNVKYTFVEYFIATTYAVGSFMLARLFRLMAIEIEQMSNREQILGVFTAVMSVFPLIEKVIELFKGVG